MVVRDLHLIRTALGPDEANAVLAIDADGVLTISFATQRLQSISRGRGKVTECSSGIKQVKLPAGNAPQLRWAGMSGT